MSRLPRRIVKDVSRGPDLRLHHYFILNLCWDYLKCTIEAFIVIWRHLSQGGIANLQSASECLFLSEGDRGCYAISDNPS